MFSTSAFGLSFKYIARWEEQGVGAQWSNLYDNPMPQKSFSLGWAINFLIIDTIIYLILMWYFEQVLPGILSKFYEVLHGALPSRKMGGIKIARNGGSKTLLAPRGELNGGPFESQQIGERTMIEKIFLLVGKVLNILKHLISKFFPAGL